MTFKLKEGFLLGIASSATQIEGGDCGHNWNDWYNRGKILDGSNPARSTDHYNRWREDANLIADMGLKIYRLGIEWARLCPTQDNVDESVVAHYREELVYLREKGISVLLTVHHFTNPMWFDEKGGFTKAENIKYYMDLVALVVRSFGDLVSEYITINEPNIYATNSFYLGVWPPGEKYFSKTVKVMSNMSICHIRAYKLIHKMRQEMGCHDTKVSFAIHMRVFDPVNPKNPWHNICAALLKHFFQGAVTQAMCFGIFKWPLKTSFQTERGEYCDFIAVNYYSRSTVSGFKDGVRKDAPKNDLGWEIYPQGIIQCAEELYTLIKRPIYISENGTCDKADTYRCRYIYDHLKTLNESELPVKRYYHWCFCDNFEWIEGESARFGLVHVDFLTQLRTIKKAGEFYSEVIHVGGVTEEIFRKYVEDQKYHF